MFQVPRVELVDGMALLGRCRQAGTLVGKLGTTSGCFRRVVVSWWAMGATSDDGMESAGIMLLPARLKI